MDGTKPSLTEKEDTCPKRRDREELAKLSDLRVILLGSSWSQRSSIGNLILGKTEFTKYSARCVKVSGSLCNPNLTVINTPDLLQADLTEDRLEEVLKEIAENSAPGPHVFLLVLKPEDFTEQHKTRLQSVLENFGEQALEHSLVLISTPRAERPGFMEKHMHDPQIRDMIIKCGCRFLWMNNTEDDPNLREELFTKINQMLKEKNEDNLSRQLSREKDCLNEGLSLSSKLKPSLNLVVCGRTEAGITSVVQSMLGQAAAPSPGQCVKHQGEVCGRWVSLVELPALSGKPLEAVMQQCLKCISLCGPEGVHAFILVLPVGPLTDEDKAELQTIQDTFSSAVNPFTMILFTVDSDPTTAVVIEEDVQKFCQCFGGGYQVLHTKGQQQVSVLLAYVEALRASRAERVSSTTETPQQAHSKISFLPAKSTHLENHTVKKCVDGLSSYCLRIALIGKTGSGKSSSGNTILGRKEFKAMSSQTSVTRICQKAQSTVDGHHVAVVDTPGLFDAYLSQDEVNEEVLKCVSLLAPGPHVFLLVLQIGRFTLEEKETLELIKKGFGKGAEKFTIILFTHGDLLVNDDMSLQDYIQRCDSSFKKLISDCGNRCHVFNNFDKVNRTQVKELLEKIDHMVRENGGECYTNDMLQEAEADIQKEMKRLLQEKDEEMKKLKEMERKYQQEMENERKEREREKKIKEQELQKKEKREEEYRKRTEQEALKSLRMQYIYPFPVETLKSRGTFDRRRMEQELWEKERNQCLQELRQEEQKWHEEQEKIKKLQESARQKEERQRKSKQQRDECTIA